MGGPDHPECRRSMTAATIEPFGFFTWDSLRAGWYLSWRLFVRVVPVFAAATAVGFVLLKSMPLGPFLMAIGFIAGAGFVPARARSADGRRARARAAAHAARRPHRDTAHHGAGQATVSEVRALRDGARLGHRLVLSGLRLARSPSLIAHLSAPAGP